ncbi:Gfo/Idh/MocA family oxidoreductase [Aurantibacter crassamenti]|uniref:Gfo/Idh/MocA family protein n=1 Tax=Aurantibacter crassamenti TaxID=1837375 RepID=UPI00193A5046|nr:Gfo/Idh/MocA family oxidoreductase [Aurantibacter crassamenti]MBM1105722.1 Gfo/Idh/MocA family oxidoreductase [Aurantibacter crassamenti]
MKTIGIGFIGAGDIADLHAEAINDLQGAELIGIWNRTTSKAEVKAAKFGCDVYSTVDELLADPKIDAVFILTNMETHCEYTIKAASYGKHILVEKPAASSIAELNKMQDAIDKAGVTCMPVHNYIYEPGIMRAKQMIESGKLGDITQFYMMYNIHHADEIRARYPGVIRQILTHHSYTMLYLAGNPKTISCLKNTVDDTLAPQENIAMATIQMQNGTLSHLCASFANDDHSGDPWSCIIKVIGTKGSTRYSYRDFVINARNGAHSQTYQCYPESIKNTATHFINQVLRQGEKPLSSIEDAITCQKIIEACEQSVEQGIHVQF